MIATTHIHANLAAEAICFGVRVDVLARRGSSVGKEFCPR